MSRCGIVALVGRPNVGKSTLMNQLVGDKVSVVTPMAQTTRNQIRGIQNHPKGQIVYLDTPGIHRPRKELNRYMVEVAKRSLEGVDGVLYLVDATRPDPMVYAKGASSRKRTDPGQGEDRLILEELSKLDLPCWLVINKVDLIEEKPSLLPLMDAYMQAGRFAAVIPISALEKDGLDLLVSEIFEHLPEGPVLFPPELATDRIERFLVAEIVREKVILCTRQEVPYSCAVMIEEFDESERDEEGHGMIRIEAQIILERDSQKGIVIGKGGARLKEIGTLARQEIEILLSCRVYLKLQVKIEKDWSRDPQALRRLGYEEI